MYMNKYMYTCRVGCKNYIFFQCIEEALYNYMLEKEKL